MLNPSILNTEVQAFINSRLEQDNRKLAFQRSPFDGVNMSEIIRQIEGRKRIRKKLPEWFQTAGIYYPETINLEQCSSEQTARYKAELVNGDSLIDLTGGFGVDTYFLSNKFNAVIYCETNPDLCAISRHNFKTLGNDRIQVNCKDGIEYLRQAQQNFSCIYLDPSRRHDKKGKVFFLEDCEPDVIKNLDLFLSKSDHILVKLSPMIDIKLLIQTLRFVKRVIVLGYKNEVREVLIEIEKGFNKEPVISAVELNDSKHTEFDFLYSEESNAFAETGSLGKWLYEPYAVLLKAGAFNLCAQRAGVQKLGLHTHLYTSEKPTEFPGKRFRVIEAFNYSKSNIKSKLKGRQFNLVSRNFPARVEDLKKRLMIRDGGETFAYFFTDHRNDLLVAIAERA